jgi:hypothetical protein
MFLTNVFCHKHYYFGHCPSLLSFSKQCFRNSICFHRQVAGEEGLYWDPRLTLSEGSNWVRTFLHCFLIMETDTVSKMCLEKLMMMSNVQIINHVFSQSATLFNFVHEVLKAKAWDILSWCDVGWYWCQW